MMTASVIDVAAGVLVNSDGHILLAQRPEGKHMAGYWEFPGGKFEPGENASQALYRELEEELGVLANSSEPLIELVHHYPERSVRLHVRMVRQWQGQLQSLDQQALAWVPLHELSAWNLLPADAPIIKALLLPSLYAVSPALSETLPWPELEARLENLAAQAVRLLQWRQPSFTAEGEPSAAAQEQAAAVAAWAKKRGMVALLNTGFESVEECWATRLGFDGLHLSERSMRQAQALGFSKAAANELGLNWLSASCHNSESLDLAKQLGCDFAVLGTVLPSASHPNVAPLEWAGFADLAAEAQLPVYAIGGCAAADYAESKQRGGQGVAGISAFWTLPS